MRQIKIQHHIEAGVEYGRVVKPSEMTAMQEFAHEHVELITRDALMGGAVASAVAGFAFTLTGALNVSIAAGQALNPQGLNFETLPPGQATVVALPAAHPTLPRIDLIYIALAADQDAETEPLPHRRLLTTVEQGQGVEPYSISNFNVPTQLHNRAVVGVLQGVAAALPIAPAVGANQVALFQVRVEAAAVALTADKVTDVRPLLRSLHSAWTSLDALNQNPIITNFNEQLDDRVAALIADSVYLIRVYNDPANVLTLDLDLAALDPRYVNTQGDEFMEGALGVGMNPVGGLKVCIAAAYATDVSAGLKSQLLVADNVTAFDAGPVAGIRFLTKVNADGLAGLAGIECGKENATSGSLLAYLAFKTNSGVGAPERMRIHSSGNVNMHHNLHVLGTLSKGAGTFLIDHPLNPNNKNLRHGFVESPGYDLIYRGTATLSGGSATVDIDDACGMTPGTFAALAGNAMAFLQNVTGYELVKVDNPSDVLTGSFSIVGASEVEPNVPGDTIAWLVVAERKDAFVLADDSTDEQGRLIVEFDKPALTSAELSMLEDVTISLTVATEEGDGGGVAELEEVVHALVGRQGFPMHAAHVGVGSAPTRTVTVTTTDTNAPHTEATAALTFTTRPPEGATVTVGDVVFTFKSAPDLQHDISRGPSPASGVQAANNLVEGVNNFTVNTLCSATFDSDSLTVNLTATTLGEQGNATQLSSSTEVIVVTPFSGGVG